MLLFYRAFCFRPIHCVNSSLKIIVIDGKLVPSLVVICYVCEMRKLKLKCTHRCDHSNTILIHEHPITVRSFAFAVTVRRIRHEFSRIFFAAHENYMASDARPTGQ